MGRWMAAFPALSSLGETPEGPLSHLSLHIECDPEDREPDRKPKDRKAWFLELNYLAFGPQLYHPLDSLGLSFFLCYDIRVIGLPIF